jgi:Phage capsid family
MVLVMSTNRVGLPLVVDRSARRDEMVNSIARAALASGRAVHDRSTTADLIARRTWGDGARGAELILRAASSPASTATSPWAGILAHITFQFLASLIPQSAGADLLGRGLQLSLDGVGSITLPTISNKPASFLGEGKPVPVTQYALATGPKLEAHKLALIAALTREMIDSSNAEQIVRAALSESAALGLDAVLFSANAGSVDAPAGLLNSIAPITASSATLRGEAMAQDLAAIGGAVARVAGRNIVYVAAPEQALSIGLLAPSFRTPVLASSALAARTIIAIAPAALASAFDSIPTIEASREASLVMNDAPGEIVASGGPVATMFQGDNVALKMRMRAAWVLRASGALAWVQNVTW